MQTSLNLVIEGRLTDASNGTFLCLDQDTDDRFVYKPVSGEWPLWDFPEGTLSYREVAAYTINKLLGWDLVPPTTWIDKGPLGPGMAQRWVEASGETGPVELFGPEDIPHGWLPILSAQDVNGKPVVLAHEDSAQLRKIALFDAIINNGDRKAGHLIQSDENLVYAIDHGVSFHQDNKLRTVLWGWLDTSIDRELLTDIEGLRDALAHVNHDVDRWLSQQESDALRNRLDRLIETERFPVPSTEWPAVPWPIF